MGPMRYIIIGAGAVGGTIGGRLFAGGHEVVLVARGRHLDALRAHGLRLETPDGAVTLPIPAVGHPGELQLHVGDVLVPAVKTQDAAAVLAAWAASPVRGGTVAAESLPVVCAQNGVASERMALRRFGHVYGMCVWLPATHLEPGMFRPRALRWPGCCTSAGTRPGPTRRRSGSARTWPAAASWLPSWRT